MTWRFALVLSALLLSGCGSLSDKQPTWLGEETESPMSETLPGISDLDGVTKHDKEDAAWWSHYYGAKSSGAE